jgi:hypothetical protein
LASTVIPVPVGAWQVPLVLHILVGGQPPQVPPQPSLPHVLVPHDGVHAGPVSVVVSTLASATDPVSVAVAESDLSALSVAAVVSEAASMGVPESVTFTESIGAVESLEVPLSVGAPESVTRESAGLVVVDESRVESYAASFAVAPPPPEHPTHNQPNPTIETTFFI